MCFFKKKKKKLEETTVSFCGVQYDLLKSILERELAIYEAMEQEERLKSLMYSVCKEYYMKCLFGAISKNIVVTYTANYSNEMLSLVVLFMTYAEKEKNPTTKKELYKMAEAIQNCHRELV